VASSGTELGLDPRMLLRPGGTHRAIAQDLGAAGCLVCRRGALGPLAASRLALRRSDCYVIATACTIMCLLARLTAVRGRVEITIGDLVAS